MPMEFFSAVFVALLADSVQWDLFVRVWDSFFMEEWKTIFRLIVALLQHHEQRLVCPRILHARLISILFVHTSHIC